MKNRLKEKSFTKFYKFMYQLPPDEATMLAYLIDADQFINSRLPSDKNFFKCSKEGFINKYLTGWSSFTVDNSIKKLNKRGLITAQAKYINGSNNTWIRINYEAVNSLADEWDKYIKSIGEESEDLNTDESIDLNPNKSNGLNNNKYNDLNTTETTDIKDHIINNNYKEHKSKDTGSVETSSNEYSKNPDDIIQFIYDLKCEDTTKDLFNKWYQSTIYGRLSIGQFKEKITKVYEDTNSKEELVREAINDSITNNWAGFYYKPKRIYSNQIAMKDRPGERYVTNIQARPEDFTDEVM